jgi:hypothetical protein
VLPIVLLLGIYAALVNRDDFGVVVSILGIVGVVVGFTSFGLLPLFEDKVRLVFRSMENHEKVKIYGRADC